MNNIIMQLSTVLLFALFTLNTYGQQKYEKENRLALKNVPSVALDFINALEIPGRIKWYSEIGLENESIEVKFKLSDKRHSVEFDTTGIIQDIEIEMKWKEIQSQVRDSIYSQLNRICSSHKISKIQIQYSGNQSILLSFLKCEATAENLTTNYEIIVKCLNNNKAELFEYLFSEEGKLLKISKIIFKNTSNLEY